MGVIKRTKKPKPRPVINYPPVPTRKWIPPDKRPKPPRKPGYIKPEGITQKLALSSLKRVWNKYDVVGDCAILVGTFSQESRKFTLKSRGYQGACNCVTACIFAHRYKMADFTRFTLDRILNIGDALYLKSIQPTGDTCLLDVPPKSVFNTIFMGTDKITFTVDDEAKIIGRLNEIDEDKIKDHFENALEQLFKQYPSGIFTIKGKYVAVWIQDAAYYFFDPTEHYDNGDTWKGVVGWGLSLLWRCKKLRSLVDKIYRNVEANIQNMKFEVAGCVVERIIKIKTEPPETIYDVLNDVTAAPWIPLEEQKDLQPVNLLQQKLENYVGEDITSADLCLQEVSPDVGDQISESKRTSWMADGALNKMDVCKYPIPAQKLPPRISYYTELVPEVLGILRGSTCQTDIKMSKYQGRQSMGNAISALIMLRFYKSSDWVPKIVNTILKNGDLIYRDAMITIPRTQSLKLSNFQRKTEYEGKLFMPIIEEYVVIGKLQSQEFDVLDLCPALESFLADRSCCVVVGPLSLAVWTEEDRFYMFDPNERDKNGKAITKSLLFGNDLVQMEYSPGVACVLWFHRLEDLVDLYMNNVEKSKRTDTFYLCDVVVNDYVDIPEAFYNFKGIEPGKWILRGTISQSHKSFKKASRNLQSPATCFMALLYQLVEPVKDWSEETVDEILVAGDKLYNDSIEILTEKGILENRLLTLGEVKKVLTKDDQEIHFGVIECFINGILSTKDNDISDLEKALEEFFVNNDIGIITCRQVSLAVWRTDQFYYCFDSHDRDEKGKATGFGTACVLRVQLIEDLAKTIESNFVPSPENLFNINRITISIFECKDGDIQPPLNNYVQLKPGVAILRSIYSEISNKFGITKGKQTIAMCLSAIAYNKLKPALTWSKADVDEILNKGDNLHMRTMATIQQKEETELVEATKQGSAPPPDEEEEEDESANFKITAANILTEFTIGFNKFSFEFNDNGEGNLRDDLKEALKAVYETLPEDESNNMEIILESKPLTVAMWVDKGVFYLFDSRPRDKQGLAVNIIQWVCPECVATILEKRQKEKEEQKRLRRQNRRRMRRRQVGTEEQITALIDFDNEMENRIFLDEELEGEMEGESEEESEFDLDKYYPLVEKSSSFWQEKEKTGKACIMWFTHLDELIEHVYNNVPAWEAKDGNFTIKVTKINNSILLKDKLKPEDERTDVYAGDWYFFQEIEHGKWILKGTMTIFNELFPKANRGKQIIPTTYVALATAFIFGMICFNDTTVDSILRYGDKLYSYVKRMRKKQILQNNKKHFTEDEIDWLIENEAFEISDIPRKICISKFTAENAITTEVIKGDIKAQNSEEVLDVLRGINQFFTDDKFGILESRGLYVAIWKTSRIYYMFDGLTRGPSGIVSPCGSACIVRYLKVEHLAEDFLKNLPEYGKNDYCIHSVKMLKGICPRFDAPKILTEPFVSVKEGGFREVMSGKRIISCTINQEDPKFGKEPNCLSAPIAIIALTMTLLHKTETWTKPLLDDIIEMGNELYEESVDYLGFDFDSWEEKMDVYKVKKDYCVGFVKANCELRLTTQSGIIDTKSPYTLNLRQGIEHFFEENVQGIIVTEPLTLAIWEEEQQLTKLEIEENEVKPPLIYMFDPNPRNASGMPLFTGTACLVSFNSAKLAAEHIVSCILQPELRGGEFTIVPVEIVVAGKRTKCKLKETPTKSTVNLPRCSKSTINEEIRILRRIAENERKRKEQKRIQLIGRKAYYPMRDGEAIIRGYRSQNSEIYTEHSRNNQDIPNCIVAIVMNSISTVDNWNSKHIDLILDTGEQLYIDSYIAYCPKDKKLGLENIVRKFFMGQMTVHVTIYQPILTDLFMVGNISRALNVYFQQETYCMLSYMDQWLSIFFKGGLFYLFDPHERDIEGNLLKKDQQGTAVVNRFNDLDNLVLKLVQNIGIEDQDKEENLEEPSIKSFSIWLISVEIRL